MKNIERIVIKSFTKALALTAVTSGIGALSFAWAAKAGLIAKAINTAEKKIQGHFPKAVSYADNSLVNERIVKACEELGEQGLTNIVVTVDAFDRITAKKARDIIKVKGFKPENAGKCKSCLEKCVEEAQLMSKIFGGTKIVNNPNTCVNSDKLFVHKDVTYAMIAGMVAMRVVYVTYIGDDPDDITKAEE